LTIQLLYDTLVLVRLASVVSPILLRKVIMAKNRETEVVDESVIPIPEGYEDQQTGLPPYWSPDEEALEQGKAQYFHARVIDYDDTNPEFHRWVLQALAPTICHRGPARDAEEVHVRIGEFFSVSDWAGLPLARYLGHPVFVFAKNKRPFGTKGRTVWEWGLRTTKEVAALVAKRNEEMIMAKLRSRNATPQLAKESAADSLPTS
jgi:hypothetical protein